MFHEPKQKTLTGAFLTFSGLLILIAALISPIKQNALSQDAFRIKAGVFDDNRDVTIFLNDIHLQKDIGQNVSLSVHHEFDAVSSASIGCTVCHQNGQDVDRNEFDVGAKYIINPETNTAVSLNYYNSTERDYLANALTFSAVREFFNRNTTLATTYSFSNDNPHPHGWRDFGRRYTVRNDQIIRKKNGRTTGRFKFGPNVIGDRVTDETKRTHRAGLSWTQVLTPKTIAQVNINASFVNGYQANPHHIVRVDGQEYIETHPDTRTRRAFVGQVNQAWDRHSFIQGSYRYYNDTWGIGSHTIKADIGRYFQDKTWLFNLGYRYYTQSEADFYQDGYLAPQEFMTDDYRLNAFNANRYRAKVIYAPQFLKTLSFTENLRLDGTYEHYRTNADFSSNLWQLGMQARF
jgi:hypothetical protein